MLHTRRPHIMYIQLFVASLCCRYNNYAWGTDTEAILNWFGQCLSCVNTLYHADRDIVLPFLSVRLSVRHVVLLRVNKCICRQNVWTVWRGIFLVFRLDALAKALSVIDTATWLGGWVSVTAGIVSKRLNLS